MVGHRPTAQKALLLLHQANPSSSAKTQLRPHFSAIMGCPSSTVLCLPLAQPDSML